MTNGKLNVAICISGGGTTMREVLRACKDGRLPRVNPALIISSRSHAGGIDRAKAEKVADKDIVTLERCNFENSTAYGEAILQACTVRNVDLIAQCGFIPRMPSNVIDKYRSDIFNQHPGPLDQDRLGFGGKGMFGQRVHYAVIYFARRIERTFHTEATVHRVTDEVDGGAILGIIPVSIAMNDSADTLAARVLPKEHELVIDTLAHFSIGGAASYLRRAIPLIHPCEEELLKEAKQAGIDAFPNG